MPRSSRSVLVAGLLTAGLAGAGVPLAAAAQAADPATDATLTVVHGVRGLVADVRLDDQLVLSGFAPERVTEALTVPAGSHHLQAWPSGAAVGSTPVLDQTITLAPGERATAGIGLDAQGAPVVTVYDDGTLLPDAGSTALAVRNLAQADPVTVTAGGTTVADGLAPAAQQVSQVAPGTYPVTAVSATGGTPVVPSQDVPVVAGRAVVLYLIGSQQQSTLGWVAQTVRTTDAPARVDTGVGPLPADRSLPPLTGLLLVLPVGAGLVALRRLRTA